MLAMLGKRQGEVANSSRPSAPAKRGLTIEVPDVADVSEALPPINQRALKMRQLEADVLARAGCGLEFLRTEDVAVNRDLRRQLEELELNEFFDDRGIPRCRRLGLAFTASLNVTGPRLWGSEMKELSTNGTSNLQSAKAFMKAQEAKEKDIEQRKKKVAESFGAIDASQKLRVEDVALRQVEVIFIEIPDFKRYLPAGVVASDLVPMGLERNDEMQDRLAYDRANAFLGDKHWIICSQMNWILTQWEVAVLLRISSLWNKGTRPLLGSMGMDRPTFCRFILDVGLVSYQKAPFHWAISLFDEVARPMHCMIESSTTQTVPVSTVVCNWHFVCIVDMLLRARFGPGSVEAAEPALTRSGSAPKVVAAGATPKPVPKAEEEKAKKEMEAEARLFAKRLLSIARQRLHPCIVEASGVTETEIQELLDGQRPESDLDDADRTRNEGGPTAAAGAKLAGVDLEEWREIVRDQLVYSFLVEPEVLHLVSQHREIFTRLQACYADEEHGGMSFESLLQFFVDFHLSPSIASSHILRRVYSSARCLDTPPWPVALAPISSEPGTPRSIASGSDVLLPELPSQHRSGERRRRTHGKEESETVVSREASPVPRRSRGATPPLSLQRETLALDSLLTAPSSKKKKDLKSRTSAAHTSHRSSFASTTSSSVDRVKRHLLAKSPNDRDSASVCSEERDPGPPLVGIFGLSAFVEVLCRVAFTHLEWYGNGQQFSTGGLARVVWLTTYLRCVFAHLRVSMRRQEGSTDRGIHAPLMAALRLPNSLWDSPLLDEGVKRRAQTLGSIPVAELPSKANFKKNLLRPAANKRQFPSRLGLMRGPARLGSMRKTKLLGDTPFGSKTTLRSNFSNSEVLATPSAQETPARHTSFRSGLPDDSDDSMDEHAAPSVMQTPRILGKAKTGHWTCTLHTPQPPSKEPVADRRRSVTKLTYAPYDIGQPWVVEGKCRRCSSQVDASSWGKPSCAGCSVVDAIDYERHFFRALLVDPPEGLHPDGQLRARQVSDGSFHPRHAALTPPQLCSSNALRRGTTSAILT